MYKKLSWEDVYSSCKEIARQCKDDNISAIIAVSRGGYIPARIISELLNVPKIYSYGISSYKEKESSTILEYQNPIEDILTNTNIKEIIIVDEIADTGKTFLHIHEEIFSYLKNKHNNRIDNTYNTISSIRFASLYVRDTCSFKPSLYHKIISSKEWIIFPWEKEC